ncbi:histidine phosphatase family protein [Aquiflexum sp. TKW24L]|uniref:SixA phosphatase family protein n=1 Tax=Aquiflexum sp. TKW24L TaxID=2942212 RepID=UPI0020BE229D|nr:histidine phosphatase family protein [Aquiflexum sp. TKW24L]MCL6259872.1 histidine phosphatase family protein [Aquiflexum sp. TKW24L]
MATQKFLYLLRHGEAIPGIGQIGDIKRPLSDLGKSHIKRLLKTLEDRKTEFDLILISPSVRTSQTAKIISDAIPPKKIVVDKDIYDAEVEDLLKILQNIESLTEKILMVGHNPALSSLVTYLTGDESINMNPGMMAIIEILVDDWLHVGKNAGLLVDLIN